MAWQLTALPDDTYQWVWEQTGETAPYDPNTGEPPPTPSQMYPQAAAPAGPVYSDWATSHGLTQFEDYLGQSKSFSPEMVNYLQQMSSVAPQYDASGNLTNGSQMWSDFVTRVQDRESGGNKNDVLPESVAIALGIPLTAGMTGYNAATGGDIGAGVTTDLAALGSAGVGAGVSALGAPAAVSGAAGGATGGAISSGGDPDAILTGAGLGAAGAALYGSFAGDASVGDVPTTNELNAPVQTAAAPEAAFEPMQTAALDTGTMTDVTAPTTGALMPAAVPEPAPSFDNALTQAAPDVFSSPLAPAPVSSPQMPAAVPEPDPTFGGALAPTGAGVFESPLATPTPVATPAPVPEPTKVESTPLAAADTTTPAPAPAAAPAMPAAVPEADPTFGGALTQTAPGAFTSTPTPAAAEVDPTFTSAPTTTAAVSAPSMPAAVPEADPTFGGALSNTAPDVFSSPLSTGSVAPSTVTGNDATGSDTITPAAGGVGTDGSADTNTNTGGTDTGAATQSAVGLTGTTGTSSDTGTSPTGDTTLDSTGFQGPTETTGTDTGGSGSGTGSDPTLDATGFPGPTGGAIDVSGARADTSSPDLGASPFDSGSTMNFGSGGTGGGGDGLGSDLVDYGVGPSGASDTNTNTGGTQVYDSPRPGGMSGREIGDIITKYGPLSLGVAGILNQQSAGRAAAAKLAQVGSEQRAIAGDLLAKYKSGELNAADKLAIDEWQRGAIAQVRQYYANAHQSDSSAAVDAEARVNARAEAMKEAARQGLLKMGLDTLNITDRYQAAAASAEYNADQQMLANAINFMNAYGSWLRGAPKSTSSRRSEDVAAATGNVTGPDISVPDFAQNDYSTPPGNG